MSWFIRLVSVVIGTSGMLGNTEHYNAPLIRKLLKFPCWWSSLHWCHVACRCFEFVSLPLWWFMCSAERGITEVLRCDCNGLGGWRVCGMLVSGVLCRFNHYFFASFVVGYAFDRLSHILASSTSAEIDCASVGSVERLFLHGFACGWLYALVEVVIMSWKQYERAAIGADKVFAAGDIVWTDLSAVFCSLASGFVCMDLPTKNATFLTDSLICGAFLMHIMYFQTPRAGYLLNITPVGFDWFQYKFARILSCNLKHMELVSDCQAFYNCWCFQMSWL